MLPGYWYENLCFQATGMRVINVYLEIVGSAMFSCTSTDSFASHSFKKQETNNKNPSDY